MTKARTNCGRVRAGLGSLILGASLATPAEDTVPEDSPPLAGQLHTGWESRYFSEGRDALSGDALWATRVDVDWNALAGRVWYASSPQQSYDELHLQLAYGFSVRNIDLYAAYTWLDFPSDGADDNEVSAGFTWAGLPRGLEFSADAVYSFDAGGSYAEFALGRGFAASDSLVLKISGIFGLNDGYIADGHDGATNIMLNLGVEYRHSRSIAATAFLARSWALGKDRSLPGDEQLIDFTHGGIGLSWSFGAGEW